MLLNSRILYFCIYITVFGQFLHSLKHLKRHAKKKGAQCHNDRAYIDHNILKIHAQNWHPYSCSDISSVLEIIDLILLILCVISFQDVSDHNFFPTSGFYRAQFTNWETLACLEKWFFKFKFAFKSAQSLIAVKQKTYLRKWNHYLFLKEEPCSLIETKLMTALNPNPA